MSQNVESIEGVESSIKAIEKMSYENPYILIEKGAFISVLSFIDFFELSTRKSALKACVNMSKVGNNIDYIRNHILKAIPNLTNLSKLNGNSEIEKTIVDLAIQSIYNILNGVKNYNYSMDFNDFCEDIIKDGLINVLLDNFIKFINVEEKKEIKNNIFNVNVDTIKNILKIFELLCIMSNNIANTLLNKNMLELIYKVIKNEINYNKNDGSKVNSSNTHSLFNELFNLLSSFFPNQLNKNNINLLKTKIMSDENKNYYDFFSEKILILLIENILNIPSSSTTLGVIKIIKMYIANSKNDYIQKYIDDNQLSNSISKMLDSKDSSYIIEVLSLVYLIMNKIPELFIISFLRDGVVENVSKLNQIEENNLYVAKQTNVSILTIFDNCIDNPKENENHII
jgi:E3 ubiquitin-protein ligase TRIP12